MSVSVFTRAALLLSSLVLGGCLTSENPYNNLAPVAIGLVIDPTTEISLNSTGTVDHSFLDQIRDSLGERLVSKLLPGDEVIYSAVSENASHTSNAFVIKLPADGTTNDKRKFLEARDQAKKTLSDWADALKTSPPCRGPNKLCSDIFGSILLTADSLQHTASHQKLLIVYSDMQENVRRSLQSLPSGSLEQIDVLILFAFPRTRDPKDYEPFRIGLTNMIKTGNPRSVRILFPAEVPTLDLEETIKQLRRSFDA